MNSFFTDTLSVSKITLCIGAQSRGAQLTHQNRPSHGLVIWLSGKIKYRFDDGSEMIVEEGELFYLPKYSTYRLIPQEDGDYIAVNFDLADEAITYPHFSLDAKNKIKYSAWLKELLHAWEKRTPAQMNVCMAKLYEIICAVQIEGMSGYRDAKTRQLAAFGADYIAANIGRPDLSVHEIAKELTISPEYFRRIFSAVYGISPKKYIIMVRIEKAKELIASNELSMCAISQLCGYEYECYFSRDFKKRVGVLPSQYRYRCVCG